MLCHTKTLKNKKTLNKLLGT